MRFWFTFDTPVSRRDYRMHGAGLALVKYAGDALLVAAGTGRLWTPQDYLRSVHSLLSTTLDGAPVWLAPALTLWTLPFLSIGIGLTMRRARDAGWSPWWSLGFFVPFVNYLLIGALCVVPGRPRAIEAPTAHGQRTGRVPGALIGLAAGVLLGLVMTGVGIVTIQRYGLAVFFGTPFAMGAIAAFFFNRRARATPAETAGLTMSMFVAATASAFLLGMEGAVCLVMALPFALVIGLIGAKVGRSIALLGEHAVGPAALAVIAFPISLVAEPRSAAPVVHHVESSVVIDASADVVWRHVIAFEPIPEPTELLFRAGIAYPRSARLEGTGVGARRYCEFNTGAFVEPITAWEPGRRLSFDVVEQPLPLRELSIHDGIAPPHLSGYLKTRRGEFRLVPLADGRTRLEGSTWYELDMAPAGYWRMFSDYIIHRIHLRVLAHIRAEVAREHSRTEAAGARR